MEEIQQELNEAWLELQTLAKETRKLSRSDSKKSDLSKGKSTPTSSWALSKTTRSSIPLQNQSRASSPDLLSSNDKSSATKSGFTISKSIKRSIFDPASGSRSKEDFYDPNLEILSSQKRSRSAIISNSDRNLSTHQEASLHGPPQSEPMGSVEQKEPVKAFSFSKAKKDKEVTKEGPTQSQLNIDSADKLIRERPQSAVFTRGRRGVEDSKELDVPPVPESRSSQINIEILSNRVSSNTGGKIAPPQRSHSRKRVVVDNSDYGNPGPGAYTDSINKLYSISSSKSKGIKFSADNSTERVKSLQKKKLIGEIRAPGPGAYDLEAAETHTRQRVPGFSNIFRPQSADTKNTPQLQRKRYWEEKARDAREDPEDRRESSFDIGTKRTPIVTIHPDVRKGIDHRNREIIRKIRAEKMREASIGYYDKKYDFVEPQPPAPVRMEQQVNSEANTKAMLEEAGITLPSQRRALEMARRDYYLGPQLQIPWEEDRLNLNKDILRDDSGEESPTEEVLRLIRKRNNQEQVVPINDTTDAYLRSSYTGTLRSKPATIRMREPTRGDMRRVFDSELDPEDRNRDYLPTQLHHEWGEHGMGDYHGKSLQMDVVTSRDTKKVHHKGVIETIPFHEPPRVRPNDYAPGDYDVDGGKRFGENVRGGLVDFNRFVSRADLIGPNGERPGNEIDYEAEDPSHEEVIVDAIHAKEKILKHTEAPKLYVNDRHERPKTSEPGLNQLGGQWFQGMATERKATLVNYDLMPDRGITESERLQDEDSIAPGDELILEVKDWKPHKVIGESGGPTWMDPKRDPRFGKEKKEDYTGEDEPIHLNYDYLKPREGLHVLDMKNVPDRWVDHADEDYLISREIFEAKEGLDRRRRDLEDAADEDQKIRFGEEMQSSKKRSANFVNMKQQSSRPVNLHRSDAPVDAQYDVKEIGKERRDLSVLNWEKIPGREAKIISKDKIQLNESDPGSDIEEVIISPKTTNLSNSRRPHSAPAWSLQKGKSHLDPPEPLGNRLHYNVDTEFGNEIKGGTANYSRDQGRVDDPMNTIKGEEELELEPNYDLLKQVKGEKSALGSVSWAKKSDLKERISEKKSEAMRELDGAPQGQVLDLDLPPSINWTDKSKRGKFSRENIEQKLKGSTEIPKELRNDEEELILEPFVQKPNSQADWKKQSENIDPRKEKEIMRDMYKSLIEADEELVLSPQRPKTQSNSIPNWKKQSQSDNNPFPHSTSEQLILSPQIPSTQRVGPAWSKQSTDGRQSQAPTSLSEEELILSPNLRVPSGSRRGKFRVADSVQGGDLDHSDEEELILHPHRQVSSRSRGGKFSQAQQEKYDDPDKEELILHPHRQVSSRSRGGRFSQAQEGKYDDPDKEELIIEPHQLYPRLEGGKFREADEVREREGNRDDPDKEELILSPHALSINKPNGGLGWKSQGFDSHGLEKNVSTEELILSPTNPTIVRAGVEWKKQQQPRGYDHEAFDRSNNDEELILSPKFAHRSKSASWSRQSEEQESQAREKSEEELILSPHLNSRAKAAPGAMAKKNQNQNKSFDESRRKEEDQQGNKRTQEKRVSSSEKSSILLSSRNRGKEDHQTATKKKVSFEQNLTPSSDVNPPKKQQPSQTTRKPSQTESQSKQGRSKTTSSVPKNETTAKPKSKKSSNPSRTTLTPPRIQPLTPSDTAVPYSFQRNSRDETEFLDLKLKELGID